MQCTTYCLSTSGCTAVMWNESNGECSIMESSSLVCYKDKINHVKAYVDLDNVPSTCQGIQDSSTVCLLDLCIYFFKQLNCDNLNIKF